MRKSNNFPLWNQWKRKGKQIVKKIGTVIGMTIVILACIVIGLNIRTMITPDIVIDTSKDTPNNYKLPDSESIKDSTIGLYEVLKNDFLRSWNEILDYSGQKTIEITSEETSKDEKQTEAKNEEPSNTPFRYEDVPAYSGSPYVSINNDTPYFTEEEKTQSETFITLSELDELGRCQVAYGLASKETMPTEEREEIGHIKPTGWHTVKYPDVIEDKYLYNRCHLLAHCLFSINAEPRALITGTRYLNVKGMLPLELKVVEYLDASASHQVLYRVTPIFIASELLCRGVLMEAYSIDDNGKSIQFCKFVYNVQPGIEIDYQTGESKEMR